MEVSSMQKYVYESEIEQQCCERCIDGLKYDHHYEGNPNTVCVDGWPGRTSTEQVVDEYTLRRMVKEINRNETDRKEGLSDDEITEAVDHLLKYDSMADDQAINRRLLEMIQHGVTVKVKQASRKKEEHTIQFIDYKHSEKNRFWVVNQMWIKGDNGRTLRPDVILYVNGLPLVTIELKSADVDVKAAYDNNLTTYRKELRRLMHYNAFLVASNGIETRIGGTYSSWEFFFPWLRVDEGDKIDRKRIEEERCSLDYAIYGLFRKDRLTDYVQNFLMWYKGVKICAENHQMLGVNAAFDRLRYLLSPKAPADEHNKLGVFWHTQGSGKSFSMVFLARKIESMLRGNFTFLIITDRDDLDDQIYRNFLHAGFMDKEYKCRPQSGQLLREMLQGNNRIVFSLIQKFRYDKGKSYPLLSDRSDILVFVDEAHRTQYKDLAENMRKGLPNARYLAFTGTPLFGSKALTNKWFGETVSAYTYDEAIADGTTVRLTYRNHQPEVENGNPTFSDDLAEILDNDNLTDEDKAKLSDNFATQMEVLKRPARLEVVAKDIAHHFHSRGYLGKGMVISVDKFTAVRMFDLVKKYWEEEIRKVNAELKHMQEGSEAFKEKKAERDWMRQTEMAVVVSEEKGENEKFDKEGLDIRPHRKLMNWFNPDTGEELQDRFKKDTDCLRLVFVCSMWLTGFDVPTLSTLYIDKPLAGHTLMQTMARANRKTDCLILGKRKEAGEIIAYSDIFSKLRNAIKMYGSPSDEDGTEGGNTDKEPENAPMDVEHIYVLLEQSIKDCLNWLKETLDVDLNVITSRNDSFNKIGDFDIFADKIIGKVEYRRQFYLYDNLVEAFYNEARPDILSTGSRFEMAKVIAYLRKVVDNKAGDRNLSTSARRIRHLLDISVVPKVAADGYTIRKDLDKEIDLSKLNLDDIKFAFRESPIKNIELSDLENFIQHRLKIMIDQNSQRAPFADRYQKIIDEYNAGALSSQQVLDLLVDYIKSMNKEEQRSAREGLTEQQLELFDILKKDKMTAAETVKVKAAAKDLLDALKAHKKELFPIDWYRDTRLQTRFYAFIGDCLDKTLPESYGREIFSQKKNRVYQVYMNRALNNRLFFA